MHRTAIGWVIYVGGHCRRAKIFYLSQPGPKALATWGNIEDMVKAIEKDERYKVLSKHEYEALLALASKKR